MTEILKGSFEKLTAMLAAEEYSVIAEKFEKALDGVTAATALVLPAAGKNELMSAATAAAATLAALKVHGYVDRKTIDFEAGRLAAMIDILAYIGEATIDDGVEAKARTEPFIGILRALAVEPMSAMPLSKATKIEVSEIPNLMEDLLLWGLVFSHKRNTRFVHYALTPAGKLIAE